MTVEITVEEQNDILLTVKCTMTAAQWELITGTLESGRYDLNKQQFIDAIRNGLRKVRTTWLAEPTKSA